MHSYFIRANLLFFLFLTSLFLLAVGCSISALFHSPSVPVSISNHRLLRLSSVDHPQLRGEQAVLAFDVDIDLRPVWNWNVKQAFVWIAVDFPTPSRVSAAPKPRHHPPDPPDPRAAYPRPPSSHRIVHSAHCALCANRSTTLSCCGTASCCTPTTRTSSSKNSSVRAPHSLSAAAPSSAH